MRCPQCDHTDSHVKDSRPVYSGHATTRRRTCDRCGHRFTTVETIVTEPTAVQLAARAFAAAAENLIETIIETRKDNV